MNSSNKSKVNIQTFVVPYNQDALHGVTEYTLYTKLSDVAIAKNLPKNAMIFTELADHYQLFITDDNNNVKPVKYVSSETLTLLKDSLKKESSEIFSSLKSSLTNDLTNSFDELQRYSSTIKNELTTLESRVNETYINLQNRLNDLNGYEGSDVQLRNEFNELKRTVASLSDNATLTPTYVDDKLNEATAKITSNITTCVTNINENKALISRIDGELQALKDTVYDNQNTSPGTQPSGDTVTSQVGLSNLNQDVLSYITYTIRGNNTVETLQRKNLTLSIYDELVQSTITHYITSEIQVKPYETLQIINSQQNWGILDKSRFKIMQKNISNTISWLIVKSFYNMESTGTLKWQNASSNTYTIAIAWPQAMVALPGSTLTVIVSSNATTVSVSQMIETLYNENKTLKSSIDNLTTSVNMVQSNYNTLNISYSYLSEKFDNLISYMNSRGII